MSAAAEPITLTDDQVEAEAARLDTAEREQRQVTQTTLLHPNATMADAYRIQDAWLRLRLSRGERLIGHKIGLTSRAMQVAMNITTPDSGFLTDVMQFSSGSTIEAAPFTDAKIEVELAFVLGQELSGSNLTIEDVLAATDHVVPALELLAARTHRRDPESGRTRTVIDTIADNAADAGIVVGDEPIDPADVDLAWIAAVLRLNGVVEETGVAAGVLGHPATGIAWLAERYAGQGRSLEPGQVVLAGSFTRPVDVSAGDEVMVDYGPHGQVAVAFS